MTDWRGEIKARRAHVPSEPLEVIVTPTEEEYYMQWRILEYGPRDEYGGRDRIAWLHEGDEGAADFFAHAPTDIDRLLSEVERQQVTKCNWCPDGPLVRHHPGGQVPHVP